MKKYAVVAFTDDNSVEAIPSAWLNSDRSAAYWPPFKTENQFQKLVENDVQPDKLNWKSYSVKLMKTAESLTIARAMTRKAVDTSTLETESDNSLDAPRQPRPNPRYIDSSPEASLQNSYKMTTGKTKLVNTESSVMEAAPHSPVRQRNTRSCTNTLDAAVAADSSVAPRNTPSGPNRAAPAVADSPVAPRNAPSGSITMAAAISDSPEQLLSISCRAKRQLQHDGSCNDRREIVPDKRARSGNDTDPSSSELAFRRRVFHLLEVQNYNLMNLMKQVGSIAGAIRSRGIRESNNLEVSNSSSSCDFNLPCSSEQDLQWLEGAIANDKAKCDQLVSHFASIGGDDYKQMILAVFKRLLIKELAMKYSTFGRKGKLSFSQLNVYTVLKRAVQRSFPTVTDKQFQLRVGIVLAQCSDWDHSRKRSSEQPRESDPREDNCELLERDN